LRVNHERFFSLGCGDLERLGLDETDDGNLGAKVAHRQLSQVGGYYLSAKILANHVNKLVVCNPRKNALLKDGNKSDRIDARKLAELLRGNQLKPVYHGETGVRMLRELSRSYLTIVKDLRESEACHHREAAHIWYRFDRRWRWH
jgi:hypothetical protein